MGKEKPKVFPDSWINQIISLPEEVREALWVAREPDDSIASIQLLKIKKSISNIKEEAQKVRDAKNRTDFVSALSTLVGEKYLHKEIDYFLKKICESFIQEMEVKRFEERSLKKAKELLKWAEKQSVILPSRGDIPYLNIYQNGRRVITFSANIQRRWDVEIIFYQGDNVKYYLFENGIDSCEKVILDLENLYIGEALEANRRKTKRYSEISDLDGFCRVLDQIIKGVIAGTYTRIGDTSNPPSTHKTQTSNSTSNASPVKDLDISKIQLKLEKESAFTLANYEDAREYTYRAIVLRRGQPQFRKELLEIYQKCVVTGCDAEESLEAAHIYPYRGEQTNIASNGLLLRSDIHTLFDRYLITIDPKDYRVKIAPSLRKTTYKDFHGKNLEVSIQNYSSRELLELHFNAAIERWK